MLSEFGSDQLHFLKQTTLYFILCDFWKRKHIIPDNISVLVMNLNVGYLVLQKGILYTL